MYPAAHIVTAGGLMWIGERVLRRLRPRTKAALAVDDAASAIDYRLVVLGGLLPDMIDKPLAWVIFPKRFEDHHLYGHTLLFGAAVTAAGMYLARPEDRRLLSVGAGVLSHFLIDPVVREPRMWFWPLLGTKFRDLTGRGLLRLWQAIAIDLVLAAALVVSIRSLAARGRLEGLVRRGEL